MNAWVADKLNKAENASNSGPLQPLVDVVPKNIFKALSDMAMLQIIFFAVFFGVVLVSVEEPKRGSLIRAIDGLNDVFVGMVWMVMKAMPIFVFALMAGQTVCRRHRPRQVPRAAQFPAALRPRRGPRPCPHDLPRLPHHCLHRHQWHDAVRKFLSAMRDAQITAFSTSSSVATLPVTMRCVNGNLGVSERTTSFVLPIGATVNMDGTSLYQAVAVVALAQFHMVDLTLAQQAVIVLTATLASIGAAAIPSAGLVLMIIVLESVGLNPAWIALIFPIDRILDMCRTVVNVTGDGTVSALVAQSEGELPTSELIHARLRHIVWTWVLLLPLVVGDLRPM